MTRPAPPRRGFTLVELLVVITVLAILIALLVPAIMAGVRAANSARVQAEINQLAQALADFKSKFGDYPPTRVLLEESGAMPVGSSSATGSGGSADVTAGQLAQRTVTAFRKFWPRMPLSTTASKGTLDTGMWYDFNGDGSNPSATTSPNPYVAQGTECLVFFLGGMPNVAGGVVTGMTGWAKTPANPFTHSQNRVPPLFEFDNTRLLVQSAATGMPAYADSLGLNRPYAFFSTNVGSGYDPNDVNFTEADNAGSSPIGLTFSVGFPVYKGGVQQATTTSPSPNPYTSGPSTGVTNVAYYNGQSFQIISAGLDGLYGIGGLYTPSASGGALPPEAAASTTDPSVRVFERDNLTNFHSGRLE